MSNADERARLAESVRSALAGLCLRAAWLSFGALGGSRYEMFLPSDS
jgi:hypothetical protein